MSSKVVFYEKVCSILLFQNGQHFYLQEWSLDILLSTLVILPWVALIQNMTNVALFLPFLSTMDLSELANYRSYILFLLPAGNTTPHHHGCSTSVKLVLSYCESLLQVLSTLDKHMRCMDRFLVILDNPVSIYYKNMGGGLV